MGFYENRILPHLLDMMMDTSEMRDERTRCLQGADGRRAGNRLRHRSQSASLSDDRDHGWSAWILGDVRQTIARKRIAAAPFPVELIGLSAAKIPVADARFHSIVSTFTLCTIPDVAGALLEIRRVLAPEAVSTSSNTAAPRIPMSRAGRNA